jgi:ABC-type Na+ transport system ATPase subunit NatA
MGDALEARLAVEDKLKQSCWQKASADSAKELAAAKAAIEKEKEARLQEAAEGAARVEELKQGFIQQLAAARMLVLSSATLQSLKELCRV